MKVVRIVANIASPDIAAAKGFYQDVLGLDLLMDRGWIATYGASRNAPVQVTFAAQCGANTQVPDLSIEVDDLDSALDAMRKAGIPIECGPAVEPWGVLRFCVRDPFGRLINNLVHV